MPVYRRTTLGRKAEITIQFFSVVALIVSALFFDIKSDHITRLGSVWNEMTSGNFLHELFEHSPQQTFFEMYMPAKAVAIALVTL